MTTEELDLKWEEILEKLKESLAESLITHYCKPGRLVDYSGNILTIGMPNDFYKKYIIQKGYIAIIRNACAEVMENEALKLELITAPEVDDQKPSSASYTIPVNNAKNLSEQPSLFSTEASSQQISILTKSDTLEPIAPGDASSLNPKYVFDTFVTGSFNKMAHAAALAVADNPGKVYNPLFMYGGVGLGKTHLMHAIGHEVLRKYPDKRVLYITSEKFTNELINSIRDNTTEAFRQKYRTIDLLLVDDVQFLSKKERTQEEFFHTFNALHDANKHIVLSSDRPPREIQTLEDRLRSRFEWGIMADIQSPDLETRIAILKKKAKLDKLEVPQDCLIYIASRIDSNIRELEGALTRVVAYASLNGRTINTDLVAEAMKNVFPETKSREINMEIIQEVTAEYFKLRVEDLLSKRRTQNIANARQIAMYLCRELTTASLPSIGSCFGGRDHTTVLHAVNTIAKKRTESNHLNNSVQELINRIERL